MSSQLSNLSAVLPPVGTAAVVPGMSSSGAASVQMPTVATPLPPALPGAAPAVAAGVIGGGAAPALSPAAEAEAQALRQLITTLNQLIAIASGQAGAAGVSGGGALGAPAAAPGTVAPESLRAAVSGSGLGSGASWSGAFSLEPITAASAVPGTVLGGGGGSSGVSMHGGTVLGGTSGSGWSLVGPSGEAAGASVGGGGGGGAATTSTGATVASILGAPGTQSAQPAVAGGGAAAPAVQVDTRRVSGTPQPGGLIDVTIRSASTSAGAARSDGAWTVLTDANGAQLQAHVHGPWASHPTRVLEGIQRGFVAVHLHADGTLHLHDVR